jgi:hypothetical protein
MRTLRRIIGFLGLALMALGFFALIDTIIAFAQSSHVQFTTVDKFLFKLGLEGWFPESLTRALNDPPAFFTFAIVGILLAWWGLKPLPPKPKFRK